MEEWRDGLLAAFSGSMLSFSSTILTDIGCYGEAGITLGWLNKSIETKARMDIEER